MGMSVGHGGRRGGGRQRRRPVSDINVTPMVDVMLVLLVIFMVTAPLLTTGVDVNLPQARTPQISQPDNKALTVTVRADGSLWLQNTQVERETLVPRLSAIRGENAEAVVYVRGDAGINYGTVMEVLALLRNGGFEKAALVTQPPASGK